MPTATTSNYIWDSDFLDWLASPTKSPVWALESIPADTTDSWGFGKDWSMCSHRVAGGKGVIDPMTVKVEGHRVKPRTWASSFGGFSFDVMDPSSALISGRRGTVCILLLGDAAMDTSNYKPVALGVQRDVVQTGRASWTCSFDDIASAMLSRRIRNASTGRYFSSLPSTTLNMGGGFATGAYPAAMTLTDASSFQAPSPHDQLVMEAVNGSYLIYSAKAGNVLTIDNDTKYGSPAPPNPIPNGTAISQIALLQGHPATLLKRILCSTGQGVNSSADVYLASWGVGLPSSLVSAADVAVWEAKRQPSGGSWQSHLVVDSPQDNGLTWLLGAFQDVGFWPTFRKGQLTVRAALDPYGSIPTVRTIRDNDIVAIERWSAWDPDFPVVYAKHRILSQTAPYSEIDLLTNTTTLPATRHLLTDISDYVWTNEANIRAEVGAQVSPWYGLVPQYLQLLTRTWRDSDLCPGDWVKLSTQLVGPPELGGVGYEDANAFVAGVDPFVGHATRLILAIPPNVQD